MTHYLGLRIQARHILTDGYESAPGLGNLLEVTAALRTNLRRTATDRDKDGLLDIDDSCPDTFGVRSAAGCPDKEGDGVRDSKDECVDVSGLAEYSGCPDKDGDGIINIKDDCPDVSGVAEVTGCSDVDGDGILDPGDKYTNESEDKDGFEDEDGGPDPDNDGDGVPDVKDDCPMNPETMNEYRDADGCPDTPPVVVSAKAIVILDKVFFDTHKATIKAESHEVLNAVANVMRDNPDILKVQVEGHTDDVGKTGQNQKLSGRRAAAVVAYMMGKGIDKARLKSRGFGESRPLINEITDEARSKNRRVEFKILKRKTK